MKSFWNEEWKDIEMADNGLPRRRKYAISNYGRAVSYIDSIETGDLLKFGIVGGYYALSFGRHKIKHSRCVHKLVAHYFLPEPEPGQEYVIHYDFDKQNNSVKNLQWATREQVFAHQAHNPAVKKARQSPVRRMKGPKMSYEKVKRLKKIINDPERKRTYKEIAKAYGISQTQLYRIKSGRDWGHAWPTPPKAGLFGLGCWNVLNVENGKY